MKTLLQKAKAVKIRGRLRDLRHEHVELALAWANDEIGMAQAFRAIYGNQLPAGKGVGIYVHLARGLKRYLKDQAKLK